jgi:hypothetical protein
VGATAAGRAIPCPARSQTAVAMGSERKHYLWWDLLGDIELGRPNLGYTTRLEDYRLM